MRISGFLELLVRLCTVEVKLRTRTEEGSSLVELALTMPIWCAVLGASELGWVTYASVEVANAAGPGFHMAVRLPPRPPIPPGFRILPQGTHQTSH